MPAKLDQLTRLKDSAGKLQEDKKDKARTISRLRVTSPSLTSSQAKQDEEDRVAQGAYIHG